MQASRFHFFECADMDICRNFMGSGFDEDAQMAYPNSSPFELLYADTDYATLVSYFVNTESEVFHIEHKLTGSVVM
jgi:hypothetical protein